MNKENVFVVIMAIIALVLICVGIGIGEMESTRIGKIERAEDVLSRTARQTGAISLGVIDGYAVSSRNGKSYDGPAIRAELFKQNGRDVPENCWAFGIGEHDGVYLVRLVTYKGQQREPVWQQEVDKVYVYGVY